MSPKFTAQHFKPMASLQKVRVGWAGLSKIINDMIEAINTNEPVQGDGIHLESGKAGTTISRTLPGNSPTAPSNQQQGGGVTGNWVTIQAFDANLNPITINVLTQGDPGTGSGNWQQVGLVDPATCQTTQTDVFTKPPVN